jgi:putative hydrolase of the HAD superfamily
VKVVIWDFDHTLGYRPDGWWGILSAMVRAETGAAPTREDFQPFWNDFPWDRTERPHPELDTPEKWWDSLDGMFTRALIHFGVAAPRGAILARQVRHIYPDPQKFTLYDDTLSTLDALSARGWTHLMLTNHVPEFRQIAAALGLSERFRQIFNSAEIGFEKPNPQAFRRALEAVPNAEPIWMIGDNVFADVQGAEALGIPAILVHKPWEGGQRYSPDLAGVIALLEQGG